MALAPWQIALAMASADQVALNALGGFRNAPFIVGEAGGCGGIGK